MNRKIQIKHAFILIAMGLALTGCRDEMFNDKYERPEWLAGKVYTQIKAQPELTIFSECLELTGYDTIINTSGSYTVFCPTDDAFDSWLQENQYNSVEDIPESELQDLVSYHLIQNPWSLLQLRTVDVYGWIDSLDESNNKPRGFKRETFLKEENRFYPVKAEEKNKFIITDIAESDFSRKAITDSRKYIPFFYNDYFKIYDLQSSDYEFYFNRPFTGGNDMYVANAKIISEEINAENGFIYLIDQVITPLKNAYQIMEDKNDAYEYDEFLSLVNNFPQFEFNEQKTNEQPGADEGLDVDSLFDLSYPDLAFNIASEKTLPPSGSFGLPENVTIRYHNGVMAPTNDAFDQLINEYIDVPGGWSSLDKAPDNIKKIIANTHMSPNPGYLSDFEKGLYNGENDIVYLNISDVVEKKFGSNCTFIGLSKAITPRAFSSVTGPIYLKPGYSRSMNAIEKSGLLPALKRANKNYMLYVESDISLQEDSSLIYNATDEKFSLYMIQPSGANIKYQLSKNDLRILLLNHVATDQPKGIARKEFIPNLAGNYLIFNNVTGEVSGSVPTTAGYNGIEYAPNFPVMISQAADNGDTYQINNWFSFSASTIYSQIQSKFPTFYALMKQAGLVLEREYRFNFISDNEFYTIFIPTDAALAAANVNAMSNADLKNFILLHFIQGVIIFTDGNKNPGYYQTSRTSESQSEFVTNYVNIYIEPEIDKITIRAKDGSPYTEINESTQTNKLAGVLIKSDDKAQPVYNNVFINGVIHEINNALILDDLDTN